MPTPTDARAEYAAQLAAAAQRLDDELGALRAEAVAQAGRPGSLSAEDYYRQQHAQAGTNTLRQSAAYMLMHEARA